MKKTFPFLTLILFLIIGNVNSYAQEKPQIIKREQLFTDKDKDFLQLWYHEQLDRMDLDEDGKYDYLALLQYYTFKMSRLSLPKYEYTDEEQKKKFQAIVQELHTEMKEYLSEKNYAIHLESFQEIEEAVYRKKKWKE